GCDSIRREGSRVGALSAADSPAMTGIMTAPRQLENDMLDRCITHATTALLDCQKADGHWVFELEADATSPAEYVLLRHYRGGAARSNVFTCSLLALYGVLPWRSVPVMPVEIMLLPKWFPYHLDKVSYWARTVLVPLLVLMALKPRAKNLRGVTIDELFTQPP